METQQLSYVYGASTIKECLPIIEREKVKVKVTLKLQVRVDKVNCSYTR